MRIQLYVSQGYREVWVEARRVSKEDKIPISALASEAMKELLAKRRRRLERGES